MYRLGLPRFLAALLLSCCAQPLHATVVTLNFDDLAAQTYVPNDYMGITFELGQLGFANNTGHAAVITSDQGGRPATPPNCMINEWGVRQLGFTASSKRFNFLGAVFSRYGDVASMQAPLVGFVGYRNGKQVGQTPGYQITNTPSFAPVYFVDVDYVLIVAANGPVGSAGWYCMDNLSYEPVPEPSTAIVLACCVCGLMLIGGSGTETRGFRRVRPL
ncbi:MAG: hypothetical protein WCL39_02555 [Armatimonadota bacterium]